MHLEFPPLAELAPGCAFNPYRLFHTWSLHQALGAHRKVTAAAKWVWVMLASACYTDGYTKRSERELAWRCGYSTRQFRRRLAELVKAKLAHRKLDQGYESYVWLLWHQAFASCSPLPLDNLVRSPRPSMSIPPGQPGPDINRFLRDSSKTDGVNRYKATSSRGSPAANGQNFSPIKEKANRNGDHPITSTSLTLHLDTRLVKAWRDWPERARQIRRHTLDQLAGQAINYREHFTNPDHTIARQARHEFKRTLIELEDAGGMLFDGTRRIFP